MSESNQEWTTGTVQFSIGGEPIEMQLTVPTKPVKLARMLPIFRQMTDSFLQIGIGKIESEGKTISCKAGCGACCRQLVPVSEAETLSLSEVVEKMPEPRRAVVKERFAAASRRFTENGWAARVDQSANLPDDELQKLADDYFKEGVACPFLEDEACSIHPDRPLACREYLVTSPAENCSRPTPDSIRPVEPLLKFSRTLRHVGMSENMAKLNFVPLVRALEWAEKHPENAPEKTGQEWMEEFFGLLSNGKIPQSQAESANL